MIQPIQTSVLVYRRLAPLLERLSVAGSSISFLFVTVCALTSASVFAELPPKNPSLLERADVRAFATDVAKRNDISESEISEVLAEAKIQDSIIAAMSKPAERVLDWQAYERIFIQQSRIDAGVEFMLENSQALQAAEKRYGVPAEIITAIIGVETKYGRIMGKHRVLDALATLAFDYPKRAKFFRKELENYLLLTREQNIDPLDQMGSYAGAMGYGQFMPSSYRAYAVDFDEDGVADIWQNKTDAIGSVANYFSEHGWRKGGLISLAAKRNNRPVTLAALNSGLKPTLKANQLPGLGFKQPKGLSNDAKVAVFSFKTAKQPLYVLGLNNFYVITRYNHSRLYAMAVLQLSQKIATEFADAQR